MSFSSQPAQTPEPVNAGDAAEAESAHLTVTDERILKEQVRRLFTLGRAGTYSIFVGLCAAWVPFMGHAPLWTLLLVLSLQFVGQLSFTTLRSRYEVSADRDTEPVKWGDRYTSLCLISGSAWGVAGVLWLPGATVPAQAMFGVIVAALCLSTVLSRHVYPKAMLTYTITAAAPGMAVLAISGTIEGQILAGLSVLLWWALYTGTLHLYRTNVETIALQLQNEELICRLADAKSVAEKKAHDAEHAYSIARKAARSRQDFLSMVTHEIRSPLASLSGLAHLLEGTDLDPNQRSYARGVEESSRLLNRLVDDLSDLTEMEALSIKLRPSDMSPLEIAQAAIHVTRHDASGRSLSIEVDELPGTPKTIHNDPDRIKQALVNLIARAIRTTEVGGVVVRLSPVTVQDEIGVRFSVTDTGAGMPSEDAARLFSSSENESDHGPLKRRDVNLTICDRLVRLMGGRAGADSIVGGGFTAWFVLTSSVHKRPGKSPQARGATSTSGQVLDFGRIYELEQDLGTARIADHLSDAMDTIADMQKALTEAVRRGDHRALRPMAESLALEANAIGLTGLSGSAAHLLDDLHDNTKEQVIADRVTQLEAKFRSGVGAITRAYPALAG